jgi:RNA polymerase sigma factor (sigma-70 family)
MESIMSVTLRKDCLEETFKDVELLIYDTIHKFQRKYKGDFDDLTGVAFLAFIRAFESFDFEKGYSFSTWLRLQIWHQLQNEWSKERRRGQKSKRQRDYQTHYKQNSLNEFLAEINQDARTIVDLILETPKDLKEMISDIDNDMKAVKSILHDYLLDMGWKKERILLAFHQIEKAL